MKLRVAGQLHVRASCQHHCVVRLHRCHMYSSATSVHSAYFFEGTGYGEAWSGILAWSVGDVVSQ
jgi:hypothetical protein